MSIDTIIVVAAYYPAALSGPWAVQRLVRLLVTVALTFGLYEIVRRVGVLRLCFRIHTHTGLTKRVVAPK